MGGSRRGLNQPGFSAYLEKTPTFLVMKPPGWSYPPVSQRPRPSANWQIRVVLRR